MADTPALVDEFRGDTPHLIGCIEALLKLDAAGALAPHGIGGHARTMLSAAACRLAAGAAQPAAPVLADDIRAELSRIEDAIAQGQMGAALVFTKMRSLLAAGAAPALTEEQRSDLRVGAKVFRVPPYAKNPQSQRIADLMEQLGAGATVTPAGEWREAERIRDLPAVHEAIGNMLEDQTGDNSTCMVRAVLRARTAPQGWSPFVSLAYRLEQAGTIDAATRDAFLDAGRVLIGAPPRAAGVQEVDRG